MRKIPFWQMVQEREEVDYGVRGRLKAIIPHKGTLARERYVLKICYK
jgi:hypothetical protein